MFVHLFQLTQALNVLPLVPGISTIRKSGSAAFAIEVKGDNKVYRYTTNTAVSLIPYWTLRHIVDTVYGHVTMATLLNPRKTWFRKWCHGSIPFTVQVQSYTQVMCTCVNPRVQLHAVQYAYLHVMITHACVLYLRMLCVYPSVPACIVGLLLHSTVHTLYGCENLFQRPCTCIYCTCTLHVNHGPVYWSC